MNRPILLPPHLRGMPPADKPCIYLWDDYLKGFGLRVMPSGRRSWVCVARCNRKLVWVTLGSLALIPDIDKARDMARERMLMARSGINPSVVKRQQRAAALAAEAQAKADRFTFALLVDQYLRWSKAEHRKATYAEQRRMLLRVISLTDFGPRPARAITARDVKAFGDAIAPGQPGCIERAHTVKAIGRVYNWAIDNEKLDINPVSFRPPKPKPHQRILNHAELKAFWHGTEKLGYPFGTCFQLLALLGQRRRETSNMTWSELDLDAGVWTIPAARTMSHCEHRVVLPPLAIDILKRLPRRCRYVFTTTGRGSIVGFSYVKRRLAEAMGITDWTLSDLPRSMAHAQQQLAQDALRMVSELGFDIGNYLPINERQTA